MTLSFVGLAIALALAAVAAPQGNAHEAQSGATSSGVRTDAKESPFGEPADPRSARRTIRVEMSDAMRFAPSAITVRRGEAVRFLAVNKGRVLHEMVLGTMAGLKKHAELMRRHPGMEHDEPHMVHVAPGKTGDIAWRFTQPGTFYFGCLVAGHLEAGMLGKITVH